MNRHVRAFSVAAVAAVAVVPMLAGCSGGNEPGKPQDETMTTAPMAGIEHGPMFPECGGVGDATVQQLTEVTGLVSSKNSVGCQWLLNGGIVGPQFSFTWFRGSPIGRERKTEELSRTSVEDINVEGHDGFLAIGTDPQLGDNLCEIGIQFDDDFIEWSVSFASEGFPNPCDVAKELTAQSIRNSK